MKKRILAVILWYSGIALIKLLWLRTFGSKTFRILCYHRVLDYDPDVFEFNTDLIDANSSEFDPDTSHPVIHLLPEQEDVEDMGGTMRLGAYPCKLDPDSKAYKIYGSEMISERHRHRYEFNNDYREAFESNGFRLSGLSPDGRLAELIELDDHPWFMASQFHPEFRSRALNAHPLFRDFVAAALEQRDGTKHEEQIETSVSPA